LAVGSNSVGLLDVLAVMAVAIVSFRFIQGREKR